MISKRNGLTSLLIVVGLLAVGSVAAPKLALAYTESTLRSRLVTPNGYGCIQQGGGLVHSGSRFPMRITADANVAGFVAATTQLCQPVNAYIKAIGGELQASLIKLTRAGVGSQRDTYSTCRIVSTGRRPLGVELRLDVNYATPPCGPGQYAQVVCLQNVDTLITDLGTFALEGKFDASDVRQHCNVSPFWHPADDSGHVQGPPVKL